MASQPDTSPAGDGPARYRPREPVIVEAIQYTGGNADAVAAFAGADWACVPPGCYVARGVTGHFFTVDAGRFAEIYEPAVSPPPVAAALEARRAAEADSPATGAESHAGGAPEPVTAIVEPSSGNHGGASPSPVAASRERTGASQPEPGDPVAELRRIAVGDIGGNAPWMADRLRAFADQLAAEMRGECQLGAVQRAEAAEAKLDRLRKLAAECRDLAAGGLPAYAAVATDILAITGESVQDGSEGKTQVGSTGTDHAGETPEVTLRCVRALARSWAALAEGAGEHDLADEMSARAGRRILDVVHGAGSAGEALERLTHLAGSWLAPGGPGLFWPDGGTRLLAAVKGCEVSAEDIRSAVTQARDGSEGEARHG